jgi:23S rRNA (guanosine2251-2'-O)-methyltransferase
MRKLKLEELERISVDEFKTAPKNHIVIVLDNVRSLHNVGSTFRTADAFRLEKIFLCGITGTPPNKEIHKTALGATDSVEWAYEKDTAETVASLKNTGYKIISIEQAEGSIMLQDFSPSKEEKYCLVFGNEVFGVDDKVMDLSDACIEIPQFGTKHSLNVSVTVGVVAWDMVKKMMEF